MANTYYSGSGSVTFRVTCTDPATSGLVDPSSVTIEVRDASDVDYRYWSVASSILTATPMSTVATGEYYHVWSLATVNPGVYVAQCSATRGGQTTVSRQKVTIL